MEKSTRPLGDDAIKGPFVQRGLRPQGGGGLSFVALLIFLLLQILNPSVCADAQPPPFHKGGEFRQEVNAGAECLCKRFL